MITETKRGGGEAEGRSCECCQKQYGEDENGKEPKLLPVYPDGLLMGHNTPPG